MVSGCRPWTRTVGHAGIPATLWAARGARIPRRAGDQTEVGAVTAVEAALRTAPATAPATLSLKTDGMM